MKIPNACTLLPKSLLTLLVTTLALLIPLTSKADVSLPNIFSSNMVLQRDLPLPVWGTADSGEKVTVAFAGQTQATTADDEGKWMVKLAPLKTSKLQRTMVVTATNKVEFTGVLVGEVWLCSGQSNMADSFNPSKNRFIEPELLQSDLSRFRVSTKRGWEPVNEKTQRSISRVGFYFGNELYRKLDVPVGLILRYNSGTPIQSWMPKDESEVIRQRLKIPKGWNDVQDNRNPAVQYNDKIAPIVPVTFRGAIWYQGERNAKGQTGWEYKDLLPFLITTWRETWARESKSEVRKFPFYYVQVPTQGAPGDGEWPWLRDGMRRALSKTENTGMAVFYDHGPSLHPEEKIHAGKRLARWALAKDYGLTDIVCSGPLLKNVQFGSGKAVLSFDFVGGGLKSQTGGDDLEFFEIAGADGKYVTAAAKISGENVIVQSDQVADPKFVRYLFEKKEPDPAISLLNAEGLPASSFLTDDFGPNRTVVEEQPARKRAPKRTLTAEQLEKRKQERIERRKKQLGSKTKSGKTPTENKTQVEPRADAKPDLSNGLAPEVPDLSADDISFALEKDIDYLEEPFIDVAPEKLDDGIPVGALDGERKKAVLAFVSEIAAGQHGNIDSLLINHEGALIFESYFRRGRANYPHYQMSITKSYTAMAVGRAIQLGHLKSSDLNRPVVSFLDDLDKAKLAQGADTITLAQAMNMGSGVRVSKEKINALRKSSHSLKGQGQIQAYLQNTDPISPQSKAYKYQSSDPAMSMQVLETVVPGSARAFVEKELLGPLGISQFGWQDDVSGLLKSAAGSSMCSRDMIKFGLLVLNRGKWNGKQLIPESFVNAATGKIHTNPQGTSYGYFWWRHDMRVGGKTIDCKSARGAGGQFIMIFDELDLVVVITAHNKGMGSVLKSVPEKLLPSFVE